MNPITLHLERSTPDRLFFERDGKPVSLDEAMKAGFVCTENDTAAILTLAQNFVVSRDQFSK